MCKVDLSKLKFDLAETRVEVKKNLDLYRADVISLISQRKIEGIRFGRCYIQDEQIKRMLHEILENDTLAFDIRVQTLYEILTEEKTPIDVKEIWLNYLLDNRVIFKNMCIKMYSIDSPVRKNPYLDDLVKKVAMPLTNKNWVYFIELVVLYSENKKVIDIIKNEIGSGNDKFFKQAGRKCLDFLKAE